MFFFLLQNLARLEAIKKIVIFKIEFAQKIILF